MRDSIPRGEGERREAAQRRKRWLIVAGLFAIGAVSGYYAGHRDGAAAAMNDPSGWPPAVGASLAAVYLVACLAGSFLMNRVMDEVDRLRGYKAASFAGTVLIVAYPTWYFLWRGGLVVEPMHLAMFGLFWLSLALATLYHRFR